MTLNICFHEKIFVLVRVRKCLQNIKLKDIICVVSRKIAGRGSVTRPASEQILFLLIHKYSSLVSFEQLLMPSEFRKP